jgi:hypothetical protein
VYLIQNAYDRLHVLGGKVWNFVRSGIYAWIFRIRSQEGTEGWRKSHEEDNMRKM